MRIFLIHDGKATTDREKPLMKLELDVWLERFEPRIILRDAETRQILLQWDSQTIERELTHGDLCLEDLCDTRLSYAERLGLVQQAQPGRPRHLRLVSDRPAPARRDPPLPARY